MTKYRGFEIVSKYESESENIKMPFRATENAAAYDIVNNTDNDIVLNAGETSEAISTKLKVYMQRDEVLKLFPRSGHGFKYLVRLANSVGIIDADYYNNNGNEGEIFVKLTNPERSGKTLIIKRGEGMVQGMFQKVLFTDDDGDTVGGTRVGGLGSTNS